MPPGEPLSRRTRFLLECAEAQLLKPKAAPFATLTVALPLDEHAVVLALVRAALRHDATLRRQHDAPE